MKFNLALLLPSIDRFLEAWRTVRICPDRISAPHEKLSFNVLTLAVALAIFILARASIAGHGLLDNITADLVATIISGFVVFVTGYVTLIWDSSKGGIEKARKWGTFFILVWLSSLIAVIVVDGIPVWMHISPVTTLGINAIFVPGSLSPLAKDTIRAIFFGCLALIILLIKTRRMDRSFSILSICSFSTLGLGLVMNTVLLLLFLYSDFV